MSEISATKPSIAEMAYRKSANLGPDKNRAGKKPEAKPDQLVFQQTADDRIYIPISQSLADVQTQQPALVCQLNESAGEIPLADRVVTGFILNYKAGPPKKVSPDDYPVLAGMKFGELQRYLNGVTVKGEIPDRLLTKIAAKREYDPDRTAFSDLSIRSYRR
jgi:hypothetical protein